jgi:AcrR family transcriptional regulator
VSDESLRERSKERRRRAIQLAGMRLFAERGFDQTTVADVAAAVAARTLSLYFATKRDGARASTDGAAGRLADALADKPPGASVVDTVLSWLRAETEAVSEEEWRPRTAPLDASPLLAAAETAATQALAHATAAALADEFGVPAKNAAVRVPVAVVVTQYLLLSSTFDDARRPAHVRPADRLRGRSGRPSHETLG